MVRSMANDIAAKVNGRVLRIYSTALQGFALRLDARQLIALVKDSRVSLIEQDQYVEISTEFPNYGLDRIDQRNLPLDGIYNFNNDGTGVNAYIIDTGIHATHSDFGGRVNGGFTNIDDGLGTLDCIGHGTFVAGIVGSANWGVAKNVNLVPVRVFGCSGSTPISLTTEGIDWVAANAQFPAVANLSFGGNIVPESAIRDAAVNNLINLGVTVVIAAGNGSTDACNISPANVTAALTVASSDENDNRAETSNFGPCIDLFAPGEGIVSVLNNGNTNATIGSGTSFASPHVAGIAVRYLGSQTTDTPAQVNSAILNAATTGVIFDAGVGTPNLLAYSGFLDDGSLNAGVILEGTSEDDSVYLNSGTIGQSSVYKDTVYGRAGNDVIYVSDGADQVFAGDGDDEIGGGKGDDRLFGEAGNDIIFGGPGDDIISGGSGSNQLFGGSGNDVIFAVSPITPDDLLSSENIIDAGDGNDTIIFSADSRAMLLGGEGDDTYVMLGKIHDLNTKRTDLSGSLEIIDGSGNNKIIFQDIDSSELIFQQAKGSLEVYNTNTGEKLLTLSDKTLNTFQFSDQTFSLEHLILRKKKSSTTTVVKDRHFLSKVKR